MRILRLILLLSIASYAAYEWYQGRRPTLRNPAIETFAEDFRIDSQALEGYLVDDILVAPTFNFVSENNNMPDSFILFLAAFSKFDDRSVVLESVEVPGLGVIWSWPIKIAPEMESGQADLFWDFTTVGDHIAVDYLEENLTGNEVILTVSAGDESIALSYDFYLGKKYRPRNLFIPAPDLYR